MEETERVQFKWEVQMSCVFLELHASDISCFGCCTIMFSYALPSSKACAVAQETLAVWCSLASRLGVWAVKAELEDLCFAVLQVSLFLLFL
jgi:hypothetical protein